MAWHRRAPEPDNAGWSALVGAQAGAAGDPNVFPEEAGGFAGAGSWAASFRSPANYVGLWGEGGCVGLSNITSMLDSPLSSSLDGARAEAFTHGYATLLSLTSTPRLRLLPLLRRSYLR